MTHLDPTRRVSRSELRKFGLLVGGAFLAIATFTYWRGRPPAVFGTFGALGGVLFLGGLAVPAALGPVYAGWMRLATALNKVTTPILMGAIYFLLLAPLGLVMRAFGWRPWGAKPGETAWVTRPPGGRGSQLERQF